MEYMLLVLMVALVVLWGIARSPKRLGKRPTPASAEEALATVELYRAYGRDVQADEILEEALRKFPDHRGLQEGKRRRETEQA